MGAYPQTLPGFRRLRRVNFSSPACTFKISRYAADYRYLIAYENNAQGWKERLGLEGVGGVGRYIFKIVIAKGGGVQFSFVIFFSGGGVKFWYTTLFWKTPAPLWDVINDQFLKRLINRKLVSGEVRKSYSALSRENSTLTITVFCIFSFEDLIKMRRSVRN